MGILDRLKNALFEEEIVEVEEKPKKPKEKSKLDLFKEKKQEKPIAKKVILPEKKETKVEELDETDYVDEDFEISPAQREELEERIKEEFDVSDDDLKVEEDVFDEVPPEPEIVKVLDYEEKEVRPEIKEEPKYYQSKPVEKHPYGMSSNKSTYSEYSGGAYEKKDSRTHFTPSPIISPIYGILDKNYKKDDVVTKKEIRLSSAPKKIDLDTVREKAYGDLTSDISQSMEEVHEVKKYEEDVVDLSEEEDLLYDLNDDTKPAAVKEVTVGDAEEYFNELGLEYNIDYKDTSVENSKASKEKTRRSTEDVEEEPKDIEPDDVAEEVEEDTDEGLESNLFDLIESMYDEKE